MSAKINLANLISILRVGLAFLAIFFLVKGGDIARLLFMILIAMSVILDAVDGIVARWLNCQSHFGEILDHTADYVVANSVWMALAGMGLIPLWVPIITTARDFFVSFHKKTSNNKFRWLSSSRRMRAVYATMKLASWEIVILSTFFPISMTRGVVYITVGLCLVRALPTFLSTRSK